jgi:hypothetical protein
MMLDEFNFRGCVMTIHLRTCNAISIEWFRQPSSVPASRVHLLTIWPCAVADPGDVFGTAES